MRMPTSFRARRRAARWIIMCVTALAVPAAASEPVYECRALISGVATAWHPFGLRAEALPGVDAFDLPAPPPPPGMPFDAWFVMSGAPTGLPNRWLAEFRPPHGDTGEAVDVWEFAVHSLDIGQVSRIEVRPLVQVSYGEALLLVPSSGGAMDMSGGGAYEFVLPSTPVSLWFELRTGSPVPVERGAWGSVKALYRR